MVVLTEEIQVMEVEEMIQVKLLLLAVIPLMFVLPHTVLAKDGYCGQRGFSWENCDSLVTHQHITQIDDNCNTQTDPHCGASCHVGYHFDGSSCQPWLNGYVQHPHTTQVYWDCSKNLNNPNCGFAYEQQNCFWSFPVQCRSE